MSKRIGILTSGGDCPGLNAIIRAVVKCATRRGFIAQPPALTPTLLDRVCWQIAHLHQEGRKFALIVIAQGVRNEVEAKEKYDEQTVVLEHLQVE